MPRGGHAQSERPVRRAADSVEFVRSFPLAQSGNPAAFRPRRRLFAECHGGAAGPSLGFLTIWPTGQEQPVVSTMNSLDGRIKANAAIVPAGTIGRGQLYVTNTTNVVLDIDGYFAPGTGSTLAVLSADAVPRGRHAQANGRPGRSLSAAGQPRDFPVLESACGYPTAPQAYSLNFTAVPHSRRLGYLTVWPTGSRSRWSRL